MENFGYILALAGKCQVHVQMKHRQYDCIDSKGIHVVIRRINPSSLRPRTPGFTLIELLVVVAIIGLLIAILIPSLMMAQESANELRCKTNMNQIYKGAFVFIQDNEEQRLPYMGFGFYRWVAQISNAIGNFEPDMYKCPSDRDKKTGQLLALRLVGSTSYIYEDIPSNASDYRRLPIDITYRGFCDQVDETATEPLGRRLTDFKNPTEEFMLVEGWLRRWWTKCMRMPRLHMLDRQNAKGLYEFFHTWERHSGTSNILFVDGHVDRLTPRKIGKQSVLQQWVGVPVLCGKNLNSPPFVW